jgi:hypothetical protein
MISVSCTVKDSKMFARSTPNTCGPRLELAHFRCPKMLNRTAKKKWAQRPSFCTEITSGRRNKHHAQRLRDFSHFSG